ncbi:putative methyltransferase SirN-like protein [Karstenula rhodostoma CBS 690.94]|uniref:Methyltransferase SirN-like protein n=1 Tax=Karstenula rhodostoma CBS 690.94 TaxID=1392251 RepID=A0A9P4PPK9_9PLEO|nr:putative methyltransferase SirN-like protein [Karstenula rhodostoma CBS 690.94]
MSRDAEEEEKYFMEGNADELQRLAYQHEVIKAHVGKFVLVPMDIFTPGLRILDSATADGLWLRDMCSTLPKENTYVGIDIMQEYFPPRSQWPDNVELHIQSITKPWPEPWAESFDLVHQRFALPAAGKSGVTGALKGLIGLMKPGGWIQMIEADHSVYTGPAMGELFELITDVFAAIDVPCDIAKEVKGMLQEEGLEQVEERVFDVPLGVRNPDTELGRKSAWAFLKGTEGLVGAAKGLPNFPLTPDKVDALARHVQQELDQDGGVNRIYVAWGRKPFK